VDYPTVGATLQLSTKNGISPVVMTKKQAMFQVNSGLKFIAEKNETRLKKKLK
jgi:hypothetical protein